MIAALLERHGLRTGCFTSPHLLSYRERIRIGERDIAPERFAAAIARTVAAAELVDRTAAEPGDAVTQFELLTAAALCEFARAGVDVAVLEAGLGGRYDATNIVDSRVAVLTNVGLEHTRYLGPTVRAHRDREARRRAAGRDAGRRRRASTRRRWRWRGRRSPSAARRSSHGSSRDSTSSCARGGGYQARNFATAVAAARAFLGRDLDAGDGRVGGRRRRSCPGRFEVHDGRPVTRLRRRPQRRRHRGADRRRCPRSSRGRRLVAVVSILDDKDAGGDAAAAARALRRGRLHRLLEPARAAGGDARLARRPARRRRARSRPSRTARSRSRASSPGPDGVVLATGSIYLIADLLRPEGAPRRLDAVSGRRRPVAAADDRGRGDRRRARDPRLRRPRLPVRPAFPVGAARYTRRKDACTTRLFRDLEQRREPRHQPVRAVPDHHLAVAAVLDARRRQAADRRPGAAAVRDRVLAVPVRRHDRLHDRAPARVPRGHPRARARDAGLGGAARAALLPRLPELRPRGREGLPDLPDLPQPPARAVRELPAAARDVLERVPVLRDAGRRQLAPPRRRRQAVAGEAPPEYS